MKKEFINKKNTKHDKAKKILLISPCTKKTMAENVFTGPHLGIIRLAAHLASKGHKAEYFDINLHTLIAKGTSFEDKLKEKDWDIIGFSTLDETLTLDIKNMYLANKLCPNALLVAGGMGSQFDYQTILDKSPCKIVALGEGEIPLLMLAEDMPLGEIPGIVFRNDAIPLSMENFWEATNAIKWETMPYEKYWDYYIETYGDKVDELIEKEIHTLRIFPKNRCLFKCNFCSSTNQLTLAAGGKAVPIVGLIEDNLIKIIERIIVSHPRVKTIYFSDDNFCIDAEQVISLCKRIIEKDFGISFMCLTRISDLNEDIIKWLVKANFRNLNIGIESFSQKVLEELNKKCDVEVIHRNLELLKKHKLYAFLNIILTTPRSTLNDVEGTVDQAMYYIKDGFFTGGITLAIMPLKGSHFREITYDYMTYIEQIPNTKFFLKKDQMIYSENPYVREAQMRYYNEMDEQLEKKIKEEGIVHATAANVTMIKLKFMKKLITEIRKKYNLKRKTGIKSNKI